MGRLNLAQCYGKAEFSLKKWTIDLQRLKRKIAFHSAFIHFFPFPLKEEPRNEHVLIQNFSSPHKSMPVNFKIESWSLL